MRLSWLSPLVGRGKCLLLPILLAPVIAACEHVSSKQIGAGMGAITGALIGSQFGSGSGRTTAAVVGAFAGGVVGAEAGGRLDAAEIGPRDEAYAYEKERESRSGAETVGWTDPDAETGADAAITISEDGKVCREFRQEIDVRGHREVGYGRACRNADGVWEIEDSRT